MTLDPIIEEVRAVRDAIAKECGYDLEAIFVALQDMEKQSGRAHATLTARTPGTGPNQDAAQQAVAAGGASRRR